MVFNQLSRIAFLWVSLNIQISLASSHFETSARIVNGNDADRSTLSNAIVIVADREEKLVCGGTLISPTLVMTAAHCAAGILSFAVVGRYDRNNPNEGHDTIPIIAEFLHPAFDPDTFDNDVLLLQLERPSSIEIDYMLINSLDAMPPVGMNLKVLGWGNTSPDGNSDTRGTAILQSVELTYISNEECDMKVNEDDDYRGKIKDNMLCTFKSDADHCYGDSGGPILAVAPTDPTRVMQVAIISWGADKCADGFFPGVNQRTSTSFSWIASRVCAVDGASDDLIKARYSCEGNETISPMPSPAPAVPTISPAPTVFTVPVWIELFMDEWPEDIRWIVADKDTGVPVVSSPSYQGNTDDEVVKMLSLAPGRTYEFVINDEFGDGFKDGGFYRVSMGADIATAEVLFSGNFEAQASHTFQTPDQTPAPIALRTPGSIAPSPSPSTIPPSLTPNGEVLTEQPAPATCLAVGETCTFHKSCCSEKCTLGQCHKSSATSLARAGDSKVSIFGESRGGAAGGAAAGVRQLRKPLRGLGH